MRDIPTDLMNAFQSNTFRPIFLVKIMFDTVLRFSSADHDKVFKGETYLGAGNVGKITPFKENGSLEPSQMDISVAGISPSILQAIGNSNYLNRDVFIWVGSINDDGSIAGDDGMYYFIGKTDEVRYEYGKYSAIKIIARSRLADWSRPRVERNMNADQQAKYPGDKGFEFVSQIQDKKIIWPRGEFFE